MHAKQPQKIRDAILDAAMKLAMQNGVMAVTLDAVCKQVGISKGGLVHYFRTKDELLGGMMERFVGHFEQLLDSIVAADRRPRHRRIRAMLKTAQSLMEGSRVDGLDLPAGHATRLMMSLLTASANNPLLLKAIRKKFETLRAAMFEDSAPDGHLALVLWMAFDGLMLWQHLGLVSTEDDLSAELVRRMQKLLEETDAIAKKKSTGVRVKNKKSASKAGRRSGQ